MTTARTILTHTAAALVGAVAFAAAGVSGYGVQQQELAPTFSLAVDTIEGDAIRVDVLDYGLTLSDCRASRPWVEGGYCMAEEDAPEARLIGYGCDGHTAPMYGERFGDFPRCKEIVRIKAEG